MAEAAVILDRALRPPERRYDGHEPHPRPPTPRVDPEPVLSDVTYVWLCLSCEHVNEMGPGRGWIWHCERCNSVRYERLDLDQLHALLNL